MREVSLGDGQPLKLSGKQRYRLKTWLQLEHQRSRDARHGWEGVCRKAIRSYQGQPPTDKRWIPFENAPIIEVTLGASDCDAIVSQAEDLVYGMDPALMVRARKEEYEEAANALQEFVDVETGCGTWNFEPGTKEGILDWAQIGTVVWYVPYTTSVRKTDVRQVVTFGPKIYSIDPADFFLPANSGKNIQAAKFCTWRMRMGKNDLNLAARLNKWAIDESASPDSENPIRMDRLRSAGLDSSSNYDAPMIEVGLTYCTMDIDDDGLDEDLVVVWNMTSGGIHKVMFMDYDYRPFVLECYQDRAHTWAGMGVMEMDDPYQRATTEIWNNHIWNMMIGNTKVFTGPSTAMQEATDIYPGKYLIDDDGKVQALDMGQINGTAVQAEGVLRGMSKERTGLQGLMGSMRTSNRTPASTTSQVMQQANRRFTHPFNNLRNGFAQVVMQCLYRVQERVRGGDKSVIKYIEKLLGEEKAALVVDLMKKDDLELSAALDVQLKAVSVTVNREADRQNISMLATQVWPQYYGVMKELATIKAHPPFPGADKVADEAATIINRFWHKLLKTFDAITDVKSFEIDIQQIQPVAAQLGMEQIPGQMQGAMTAMGGGQEGAPPQQ